MKSINSLKNNKGIKYIFDNDKNTSLKYIPSSQTNWTLNPFYENASNEKLHYREGFRKTCKLESLNEKINKKKKNIILLGSSSTYCTDIYNNDETWPYIVQNKYKNKFEFFNFGVPHFNLIQSNIRLINWLNYIKPKLVILYQAKNDLNNISNIPDDLDYINYDFENIQSQFSIALNNLIPKKINFPFENFYKLKKVKSLNFDILYRSKVDTNRLKKYDKFDTVNSILNKTLSIASLCQNQKIKFIYIPEIVIKGIHKNILEKEIYPKIKDELKNISISEFYDARNILNNSQKYFFDNMHFNKEGCKIFSEIISIKLDDYIKKGLI